jgi:hypothetical protein
MDELAAETRTALAAAAAIRVDPPQSLAECRLAYTPSRK